MSRLRFSLQEIQPGELSADVLKLMADTQGRLLRFRNAILARAEVNANRDEISKENIDELAATLPLTAIDKEHRAQEVLGYYTDARGVKVDKDYVLAVDGIVFADRYPDDAEKIRSGQYKQSIEADIQRVVCGTCGKTSFSRRDYCAHLQARSSVRKLYGLTAKGGAITFIPAGTNTVFDTSSISIIASLEKDSTMNKFSEGAVRAAQRLMAQIVDLTKTNPRANTMLYSPILAPLLWDPNEARLEALVKKVMAGTTESADAVRASQDNLLAVVEALKAELNAKIEALTNAQAELKAALEKPDAEKPMGVVGLSWGELNVEAKKQENKNLKWQ